MAFLQGPNLQTIEKSAPFTDATKASLQINWTQKPRLGIRQTYDQNKQRQSPRHERD
jgi:hypothetical protein